MTSRQSGDGPEARDDPHVVAAADAPPPLEPGALGDEEIGPTLAVGSVAFAVLRAQLRAMLRHEPGTRLGADADELHDMRVSIRRMRAAMKLFADFLPPRVQGLRQGFSAVARTLGEVRDLEVQLADLDTWRQTLDLAEQAALDALAELLAARRARARIAMVRVLDSPRYARLTERLQSLLVRGPARTPAAGREPILLRGPALIGARFERMARLGRKLDGDSPARDFHRLRIRCKSLRYAIEFHAEIYGGPASKMVRALARLQELLGKHQDAEVAAERLRALATERGLPTLTVFVMGQAAEANSARASALREAFPPAFRRVSGKRWSKLQQAMWERGAAPAGNDRGEATRMDEASADSQAPASEGGDQEAEEPSSAWKPHRAPERRG